MSSVDRLNALQDWLEGVLPGRSFTLAPASSDASFRRYFRVTADGATFIAMDAPPDKENCEPFVRIARLFGESGVNVPKVIAEDLAQGFLLLTDLGNDTYLSRLDARTAPALYDAATTALVTIQHASRPGVLPDYDHERLMAEMRLFPDWYLKVHLKVDLDGEQGAALERLFAQISAQVRGQGQVYVHRDYHSRNLMVTAEDNPGVLDFQDAVYGPVTYDLVSLFKDAYVSWDEELTLDGCIRYWEKAKKAGLPVPSDFAEFYRDYEWMGVQRHLKVLGIFARLYHRDGKDGYLKDMPLVMRYLREACLRYRELHPIVRLLDALPEDVEA